MDFEKYQYGPGSSQYFRLYYPASFSLNNWNDKSYPVVVIVHGGFWRECYTLDNSLIDSLIPYLLAQEYVVCMMEYRRVSDSGNKGICSCLFRRNYSEGGYPDTNFDMINALNALYDIIGALNHSSGHTESPLIDIHKTTLIGHSAGGTLVLWVCCKLAARSLKFVPFLCVAIAPITDLIEGQNRRLSSDGIAISTYLGITPDDITKLSYHEASPSCILPIEVNTILAIGTKDDTIPCDMVENFSKRCKENENQIANVDVMLIKNADHFTVVDATTEDWKLIYKKIEYYYTK